MFTAQLWPASVKIETSTMSMKRYQR